MMRLWSADETTFDWFPRFPYSFAPRVPGAGMLGGPGWSRAHAGEQSMSPLRASHQALASQAEASTRAKDVSSTGRVATRR
jgi:hypothetical protein